MPTSSERKHLPDVLIRVNKQVMLTGCFAQGDELGDVLSDIRITWGEFARRTFLLPEAAQDEIDLAIAAVVDLYCRRMRECG